jgi:hypothetical protein
VLGTYQLSFTVEPAGCEEDLAAAREVRAESYGRHVPALREALLAPDPMDYEPDVAVFVARDKASGKPIGTLRVQVGRDGPVLLQQCVELPETMQGHLCAEIARLATLPGADPLVRVTLMKASFLQCLAQQVMWMVIGARTDALVRVYKRLGFDDLMPDPVPLSYAGNIPHQILAFNVQTAERTWHETNNALYTFMFASHHPDLRIVPRVQVLRRALPLAA